MISVDRRNKTFEQYISCRLVNKGVYYQRGEEIYHFDGDLEDFDIALNKKEWSFEINIPKLNEGKAIVLRKVGDIPVSFAEYGDEEEYKKYFYSD